MRVELSETINRPVSEVFAFYADDHLQNHPRWDPEIELSMATDGEVKIGTAFNRRHTHYGEPVEGSMTVIEFERDQRFGLAVDDGFVQFFARLTFEEVGESATKVSAVVDVPDMPESADASLLTNVTERLLNTEDLI